VRPTHLGKALVCLLSAALLVPTAGCDDATPTEASRPEPEARIVGGVNTDISEVPWQVSIRGTWYGHFCGGSIIHERWILTAAHCIEDGGNGLVIRAGITNVNSTGQQRSVDGIAIHPDYSQPSSGSDIALLRLSSPLDLSDPDVSVVPLVTPTDATFGATTAGTIGLVSGWGALSSNGGSPATLQSVTVPIVSLSQASQAYGFNIGEDQLAAGYLGQGGKDACQGDSGGPFVVDNGAGLPVLAGVVSWGSGCGSKWYPGMYARVSHFYSWITGIAPEVLQVSQPEPLPEEEPEPEPEPAADSCSGSCGDKAPSGCWCDEQCAKYGDCCSDKAAVCDAPPEPEPEPEPEPAPEPEPEPEPEPTYACTGFCGDKAPSGCWCDSACANYGDCCQDKVLACGN